MMFRRAFLIFCVIGSFGAHQKEVDINRLRRLPNEAEHFNSSPYYVHGRRSLDIDQARRSNDYNDYIGGTSEPRSLLPFSYSSPTSYPQNTVKIHQPRENPKLYYQSDAYIKEITPNIKPDVAAIYPGREVVRFGDYGSSGLLPRKTRNKDNKTYKVNQQCIRCPRDRTLVSKAGADRVTLQAPRLVTCSGHAVSNEVKFVHMYGPKFGSYVPRGSHIMVGQITFNGEVLRVCKMAIHVIVQSCPIPKYLVAHCDQYNLCNFTCRDSKLEIIGEASVVCNIYMEWDDNLPVCRARRWCESPVPPEQGRISCKGNHVTGEGGLAEGSKCRIRCAPEWRPAFRGVTVCRRGIWTHNLQCQPKSRYTKG